MLTTEQLSLARQLDLVFKELYEELTGLTSGTVFVQIRNNGIGKFGIRHNPLSGRSGRFASDEGGLNSVQQASFRSLGRGSRYLQRRWTHGEIQYDFSLRQGILMVDATLESNYNLANLLIRQPRAGQSDRADHSCG